MRQAVALGLRLARHGAGAARVRSALVALAAMLGTAVLLGAVGLAHADVVGNPLRYQDRGFIWLAVALVLGVAVPVLVLAATVGRLSSALRRQRLASLRLLGLGPGRTRVVAAVETGTAAVVGALAGVVVALVASPLVSQVPVWGTTYAASEVVAPLPLVLLVTATVPLVVAVVASAPERLSQGRLLVSARRADQDRPSWWRVVPLAVGAVACVAHSWWLSRPGTDDPVVTGLTLVGSLSLLGIGVLLVVPVLVRLVGDAVLLLGRSPATRLAGRRIQAQPSTMTRVVAGLVLGLFVVAGARSVVVAFETTPQYVAGAFNAQVEQRVTIDADPGADPAGRERELEEKAARALAVPGVRQVLPLPRAAGTACEDDWCLRAAVLDCATVERLSPGVRGCRDDAPMWVGGPLDPVPTTWAAAGGGEVRLDAPVDVLRGGRLPVWQAVEAEVLVPPGTPGAERLEVVEDLAVVVAAPGRGLDAELSAAGIGSFGGWGTEGYDDVVTLRGMVWSVGTLVISLGLLSFGVASVDRAVERRREVAALQVVGVPARVLRRAQWIEVAAPLVIGSTLAVGAGLAGGATYLSVDPLATLPWLPTLGLGLFGVLGGVVLAGITVVAANPRLRPELVRSE